MSKHWLQKFQLTLLLLFTACVASFAGKPPITIKGISHLYKMVSFEAQVAYLRQLNPTVSVKVITDAVRQFRAGVYPSAGTISPSVTLSAPALPSVADLPGLATTVGDVGKILQAPSLTPTQFGPLESSTQLLNRYLPDWKTRLSSIYTPEQVGFIRTALSISDYSLMTRSAQGGFALRGNDWDFADRFTNTLQSIAPDYFSQEQRKELVSKNLAPGFSLKSLFRLRSLQNFVTLYDRLPSNFGGTPENEYRLATSISYTTQRENLSADDFSLEGRIKKLYQTYAQPTGDRSAAALLQAVQAFTTANGTLPRYQIKGKTAEQYTPEERAETTLRRTIYHTLRNAGASDFEKTPALEQLQQFMFQKTTPEQLLEQLQTFVAEHNRMPLSYVTGVPPLAYTAEERFEVHLRQALNNTLQRKAHLIDTDPALQRLKQFKDEQQKKDIAPIQVLLAQTQSVITRNGTFPRAAIPGKKPDQYTDEERAEIQLYRKLQEVMNPYYPVDNNEALTQLRYLKLRYNAAAVKFYQVAEQAYNELATYLAEHKAYPPVQSSLYRRITNHLYHGADEFWEKPDPSSPVYRLNQLNERALAAKRGEIAFNFIAPEVERRAAQARADHYGLVPWTDTHHLLTQPSDFVDDPLYFEEWYLANEQAIMLNVDTTAAFDALRESVRNGTPDDETYRILDKLYSMKLGPQPSGSFISVAYRGENPALPLAKHFHRVIKIEGIAKPNAQRAFEIEKQLPHIHLIHNSRYVTRIFLENGVTAQEIDQIVRALTPEGYTIRMSPHEFSLQNDFPSQKTMIGYLHLHIEKIQPTGENDPDISYIVDITANELVKNKPPHQVFKIYRDLFRQYMDDYMTSYTLPQRGVHYTP